MSLEPARLPPRRPHPAVELRRLLRREVTELALFESRAPLAGGRPRARAAEELREPARGADAECDDTAGCLPRLRLRCLDEIPVVEEVLVVRRHRVRLGGVVTSGGPERRQEPGRGGAGRFAVRPLRASWIVWQGNPGPEGLEPRHV